MSGPGSAAAASVLAQAARAIAAVTVGGRAADVALAQDASVAARRSAVRAVTLGSLRWYLRLEPLVARLLAGKSIAPVLRALLIAALHQLEYSRNPPELTVFASVDAARVLGQPRAARLVNALLRRFLREHESLRALALREPAAASAHPEWLLQAFRRHWPDEAEQIVAANNAHPPMTLRVDLSRTTRAAYRERLAQRALGAQPLDWLPSALVLEQPMAVADLPGFAEGLVSVQDAGAQLAARLLDLFPDQSVLDACAAPGGKTGAMLEAAGGTLLLTALDIDAQRQQLTQENLVRLRRAATLVTADLCREPALWWDGQRYDRILLDAPCSATGIIRRHPDIKLLRRPTDIAALQSAQQQMLHNCLGLLKPGGRLLYSTCSVLPDENERVVEHALATVAAARLLAMPDAVTLPPGWRERRGGIQLLPGNAALTDGFYYACLTVT